MVFVTIGNQDFQFTRLLQAVEKAILNGVIKQEVIVQSGHTRFESECMRLVPFMGKEEFDAHVKNASFIITHAGTGSIINGLRNNKKLLVAARQSKFGEHIDDHQFEILNAFSQSKFIIPLDLDLNDLESKIKELEKYTLKTFISNTVPFNEELFSIIQKI